MFWCHKLVSAETYIPLVFMIPIYYIYRLTFCTFTSEPYILKRVSLIPKSDPYTRFRIIAFEGGALYPGVVAQTWTLENLRGLSFSTERTILSFNFTS